MEYKGFDIVKKGKNLFWVMFNGYSILGSASTIDGAKELIDELTTCYW